MFSARNRHIAKKKSQVGQRVAKYFGRRLHFGSVAKFIEQAETEEEVDLWHVLYDDMDEEDYDTKQLEKALALYESSQRKDSKERKDPCKGRQKLRPRVPVPVEDPTEESPSKRQKTSPADDLICPITRELPWDPVLAEDNRVYERSAIKKYFKCHVGDTLKSPYTKENMGENLRPAPQLKSLIFTLVENGGIDEALVATWNEKVEKQKQIDGLLKKATGSDERAMYEVGKGYSFGWDGVFMEDYETALEWYRKAHAAGSVMATARLGEFLCKGVAGTTCHNTGMRYTTIAAAQGSGLGAFHLGMALADGLYGTVVNSTDAIFWLEKCLVRSSLHDDLEKDARKRLDELKAVETSSAQSP